MNASKKLKAVVLGQQERIAQLEKDAVDCEASVAAAHSAYMYATQRRLGRRARRTKIVDGVLWQDPNWTAPTQKELDDLQDSIDACYSAKVSRQEDLKAANVAIEHAKDWLAEMRRAWPFDFGPFPTLNTTEAT